VADSLVLARTIELLGGGQPSTLPQCAGAIFRLGRGYDLGNPQPVVDLLTTLMGDGSRPVGWRADNRTIVLPVTIAVPSTGNLPQDRLMLSGARELLLEAISADEFTLMWAPDGQAGALNLIWDCFRAKASTVAHDVLLNRQRISELVVTFDALPYGRSDSLVALTFDSPVIGQTAPVAPLTVDSYAAVSTSTQATLWSQSPVTALFTSSARWRHELSDQNSPLLYTRALFDPGQTWDFEVNIASWFAANGSTSVARSTTVAHGGTAALALTCLNTTAGQLNAEAGNNIPCVPGDVLTLSAWVRAGSTGRSVSLNASFYDSGGVWQTFATAATAADVSTGWTLLSGQVTVPSGFPIVKANMQVTVASPATSEIHYADDVAVTRGAAADLTSYGKLTCWLGLGADAGRFRYWKRNTPVTVVVTLTDNTARTLSFQTRVACNISFSADWPVWNQISLTIPPGKPFTYSSVTAYSIRAWSETHTWNGTTELDATGYLSGLRAVAAASPKRPASIRGGTYALHDVTGTAPTPLSVHCQLGYIEQQAVTQTFQLPGTPGTTNSWTAPAENPNWLAGDSSNFDTGTTGAWTGSDGAAANGTLAASSTVAHSGGFSLRATPVTGGTNVTVASCLAANVAVQGVPCQAGDRVAVRAWVRAGTTSRNITLGAQFFTSGGAAISTVSLSPVADSSGAWTQINGRVTAPATAAFARLVVTIATPAAGEFHYIDDGYLAYAVQATVVCNAAGGGGGSTTDRRNGGGGGGGGEIAWETNLDLNPGAAHAYSIGARGVPGNPVNNVAGSGDGTDGGNSSFTGASVTVLAHGGQHGGGAVQTQLSGAGGTGGTGSTNAHHFNGGNGSQGDYTQWEGGGGGGGAGDGGAGGAAGTGGQHNPGAGGAAGSLGIAGGAGDQGYGGQATGAGFGGDATAPGGLSPGGGGAGSASDTQTHKGSTGAHGRITVIIKSYIATSTFPALVVHKPSGRAGILATPVLSVGGGADPPDGREYQVPQIDGQNARYRGTFTVVLAAWSWHGTAARTVTVTIRQYPNSTGVAQSAVLSASVTPAQVVNGLVVVGDVTLPVAEMAPDNTDSYFTVSVQSGDALDLFLDVLLLDTQGATYMIRMGSGGYTDYWIDAPETTADLGRVLGSNQGRSSALSVLGNTWASGGPLRLEPGDNILALYSPAGMPALEADYWPRWHHERLA
jgi:hypothetical protein